MLSLADELRKFEKMTYQNNLDGVITVQDNFSNGSVSIRDLVKENHVIISEFKRMKNVFINYTKVNQKIYDKITEHELTFGSSVMKLGHMTNFFEKTIQETLNQMQRIYEDTVHQNRQSVLILDKKLEPVYQEMKKKVDMSVFNRVLAAMHDGVEPIDFLKTDALVNTQVGEIFEERRDIVNFEALRPKSRNFSKKVSEQQLNGIRMEITEQLNAFSGLYDQRISEIYAKIQQNMTTVIALNEQTSNQTCTKITELSQASALEVEKLRESIHSLSNTLEEKTNQGVWDNHKQIIFQQVRNRIGPILDQLESVSKGYSEMGAGLSRNLEDTRQQLANQILTNKQEFNKQNDEISKRISKNISFVNDRIQDTNDQIDQYQENSQKIMNETKNTIDYHQHQNTSELANLRETIDKLTATLEGSVLKLVIKRFTETISSLVSEVRDLKKAEAEISKRVSVSFENIHDIKEVIGRKANYADIIGLFEKKASKEDVILIKDILNNSDMGIQMEDVSANTKKPRRLGDSSRLKTSVVRSSNKYSTDRSLSSSIPVGSSFDKIKNQARLISKRFQYRPDTAELSIFN